MLTMSKDRKPKPGQGDTRKSRARDEGKVVPYTVELTPDHAQALEACRIQERRTKKAVVLLALEEYLAKAGLWPPAGTN